MFFPQATNCCSSRFGKAGMKWEHYVEEKRGGGLIWHARQYILPSRSTLQPHPTPQPHHLPHRTHLFSTLPYQDQMDPTVFGCVPASQPPFSSLSPPGFTRLWHPTDFVTLWFLARREKYQARVSISSGKELSESMRRRLWEHKQAFLCLLELVCLYFPYLVCLLDSYFHLHSFGLNVFNSAWTALILKCMDNIGLTFADADTSVIVLMTEVGIFFNETIQQISFCVSA